MPPAKKPVWDKFLSVTVNGVKKGKCKACNTEIVNNPVRLEAHLKKCAAKPDDGTLRSSLGVEKAGKMAFLFKQLNKD